jgi:hypothetical protein
MGEGEMVIGVKDIKYLGLSKGFELGCCVPTPRTIDAIGHSTST